MLWYIHVPVFALMSLATRTQGTKFPERKQAIIGETYFGSEQLLKTEIDDVKPFIAELTLPETGLEVSGSAQEIYEQFERHNKENVTYSAMVINWIRFPSDDAFYVLDLNKFDRINQVQELWIRIETEHEWITTLLYVDITAQTQRSLTKLHLLSSVSSDLTTNVYVPGDDFRVVLQQLTTLHLRAVTLKTINGDVGDKESRKSGTELLWWLTDGKIWHEGVTQRNSLTVLVSQDSQQFDDDLGKLLKYYNKLTYL